MNTNYRSVILAISVFFALSPSIFAAPGDLDPTFGNGGIALGYSSGYQLYLASDMAIQPDGKIVVVGQGVGPSHGGNWECAVVRFNTDGSLDTSFGGTGIVITPLNNFGFSSVAIQPDGKIVVVGVGGAGSFGVVRYNSNGSLDSSFNGNGLVLTPVSNSSVINGIPNSVAIQTNGKIVVAGSNGTGSFAIVRYNPNGSLDTSFNGSGIVLTPVGSASSVAIQADGKIIAAGGTNSYGSDIILIRYNADGSLDPSFNGTGIVSTPAANTWGGASDLAIQPDGKLVVIAYSADFSVFRYNPDGSLDSSFGGTGKTPAPSGVYARSVAIQPNGKIVIAGGATNDDSSLAVGRLNPNGSADTSFNGTGVALTPVGNSYAYVGGGYLAIQADGNIVVSSDVGNDDFRTFVAVRYQGDSAAPTPTPTPAPTPTPPPAEPGDLDPTFGNGGKLIDGGGYAYDEAVQSDGKIVVLHNEFADFVVARYNQDGSPDVTFGFGTGRVTTDLGREEYAWSIVIQPDGKIVTGGVSATNGAAFFFVVSYNSDGSFDTGFGGGTGKVLTALPCGDTSDNYGADFTIQPDGKFVGAVKFEYCPGQLIRYLSDGSLDVSFGNQGFVTLANGTSSLTSVVIQPDGKIIWGFEYSGIYRYESNGSPDLSFDSAGHASFQFPFLRSVISQPDGKIMALGTGNGFALVRYNLDGSLDTSFGLNGVVTTSIGAPSALLNSVAIQPDGKILAAGSSTGPNGTADFAFVRYNGDGSLDGTFGGGDGITTIDFDNSNDGANGVVLDSLGRAVVVGTSNGMFAMARIFLGGPTCSNAIDCTEFFVRQHYHDFLNREPDPAGLAFWMDQITSCGSDAQCVEVKRINVSASFFLSIEFQETGYFAYRVFKSAYGDASSPNVAGTVPVIRFNEFLADAHRLGEGVQVGIGNWQQQLETNKDGYALEFVQRTPFISAFPLTMTATDFVSKLAQNTDGALSTVEKSQLIALLGTTPENATKRAAVLRAVADDTDLRAAELNRAFVLMQYFGYLRRNPDDPQDMGFGGWKFWLDKLNYFNGNFQDAEMVKAFLFSLEYRHRFGP